jgi:phage terminase small subunit
MTDKQTRFALEYLIDGNATRAYIAAGFSANKANTNAFKLLQNTAIAEFIKSEQEKTANRLEITREFIINEYLELIESAKTDEVGPDRTNWNKSLSQLAKLLGLDEPEKQDITSNGNQITGFEINIKKPLND